MCYQAGEKGGRLGLNPTGDPGGGPGQNMPQGVGARAHTAIREQRADAIGMRLIFLA